MSRLVASDLRYGIGSVVLRYLAILCAVLGLLAFMVASVHNSLVLDSADVSCSHLSFGDFFCAVFGGTTEHLESDMGLWSIPAAWVLICALCFYLTLDYPYRDLMGIGKQLIVASGTRWGWWLSKCLWTVIAVLLVYALVLGICALATLVVSGRWVAEMWEYAATVLGLRTYALIGESGLVFDLSNPLNAITMNTWPMGTCLVTILLMLIALCLVQLSLSLLFGPLPAFATSMGTLLVSAWAVHPALLGNYLMVTRTTVVSTSGVDVGVGTAISIVLILVSVLLGGIAFSRMDILGGERWAS